MKISLILLLSFVVISCGKKESTIEAPANGYSDALSGKKDFAGGKKAVTDEVCIDEPMIKELGESETVKKVLDDADITFCNGLRVRVKVFKTSGNDVRVYGFAQSTSGHMSCLKQGSDYKRLPLLGDRGTLVGDGIKIALGGHSFSADGKLIRSDRFKGKFVRFDVANYSGEMAFFENDKLKCHAIN